MKKSDSLQSFEELRDHLLSDLILGIAIIGTPAFIASVLRSSVIGFQGFMLVQLGLIIGLWSLWFKRSSISYAIRTSGLLLALWVVTFAAMIRIGPVADGKSFILLFAFSCMLFLKPRMAWLLVASIVATLALLAFAAVQYWLQFDLDYQVYAHHPLAWNLLVWTTAGFSIMVAFVGWRMVHGLRNQSEANRELAERLERISARLPGMIFQCRVSTNGRISFPYVSEAIEPLFGLTPEMVRTDASALFSRIHEKDVDSVRDTLNKSASQLRPWEMEFRVINSEGVLRWYSGSAIPAEEEDGNILWHGFAADCTTQKDLELVKDEFISTVSHELRTPLTAISGAIKLVNSGVLDTDGAKRKEILQVAEKNSDRLLFLINDLLDVEKLETGNIELELETIGLRNFIQSCIVENQSYADQYHSSLRLVKCDDVELRIDKQRMKQALANLLSNACKFSPDKDPVEIRARLTNGQIVISVTDHGPGIPEEFHDKLFKKFTQADSSNTRELTGTGLGLSIVKKIVELHGGQVEFVTGAGTGTRFSLILPESVI